MKYKEKNKIVYILTVDDNFHYLDELYLSIKSLKYYNPKKNVEIVCDENTLKRIKTKKEKFEFINNNAKFIETNVPISLDAARKSRYIKTNLRNLVVGDFLYIDLDTIICDMLPDEISQKDIGMVSDHNLANNEEITQLYKNAYREISINVLSYKHFFNAGVIWARDNEYIH